jgi:hypothetical protein
VSAADPLQWNFQPAPSGTNEVLERGLDILDFAVGNDGTTVYAVGKTYGGYSGTTVTVNITYNSPNAVAETYDITYVDQDGVAANAGTISVSVNATAGATATLTLAGTDLGIHDLTTLAVDATDAVAGEIIITDDASDTVLGSFNAALGAAGEFVDGGIAGDMSKFYKSTNAGKTWVDKSDAPSLAVTNSMYVAVAPDAPNIVAIADGGVGNNPSVYISTNGGATFGQLGTTLQDKAGAVTADEIYGVEIAAQIGGGTRYVACPGTSNAGENNAPALYYFNLGAASPVWKNAVTDFAPPGINFTVGAQDTFRAVAFSPNFPSDYTAVAITESAGYDGQLELHVLSFNAWKWDANLFPNYPSVIATGALTASSYTVQRASVALSPDYTGSDEVLRVAFVGYAATDNASEAGAIVRCNDVVTPKVILPSADIASVDYDGTNLVAGSYDDNTVYRCADPLSTTPTPLPARSFKRIGVDTTNANIPGVDDQVIVAWNGADVLGAKQGDASAFSVSSDAGMTWNDISLIDSALTTIDDIYVTPDGSAWYIAANDGQEASLYRNSGGWQRVLCVDSAAANIVRGAPDDNNSIYVVAKAGTAMYYSGDTGQSRWYSRTAPGAVTDMAVESSDVVYVGVGGSVRKSVNSAFTWGPPKTPELSGDGVATMLSLGENNLILGGNAGHVSYTTDGASSWVKIGPSITAGANLQVTATGLESGEYIFATGSGNSAVYRWKIGSMGWTNMNAHANYASSYGIALNSGALYVLQSDGVDSAIDRTLSPTIPEPIPGGAAWSTLPATGYAFNSTPSALKISTGSVKLWAVKTAGAPPAPAAYQYEDTLVDTAPALVGPEDGTLIQVNSITGLANSVAFTWKRVSLATNYKLYIALDKSFLESVYSPTVMGGGKPTVSAIVNPADATLVPGTTYYWRVKVNNDGPIESKKSETRSFTVQPGSAAVPTVGSPANGSTIKSTQPAFSWNPVSQATTYEFQLASSTNFAIPLYSLKLAVTGIRPDVTLEQGMTYFWRVRAIEPVKGDWSTIANFAVAEAEAAPPPPVKVEQVPAPIINIPAAPPAQEIIIPEAPQPPAPIAPGYIWAIIIIGAVLVIAVIVLIVRTRRTV